MLQTPIRPGALLLVAVAFCLVVTPLAAANPVCPLGRVAGVQYQCSDSPDCYGLSPTLDSLSNDLARVCVP